MTKIEMRDRQRESEKGEITFFCSLCCVVVDFFFIIKYLLEKFRVASIVVRIAP